MFILCNVSQLSKLEPQILGLRYYGKNKYHLAHVCQLKMCCDLENLVNFTDFISILSCLKDQMTKL